MRASHNFVSFFFQIIYWKNVVYNVRLGSAGPFCACSSGGTKHADSSHILTVGTTTSRYRRRRYCLLFCCSFPSHFFILFGGFAFFHSHLHPKIKRVNQEYKILILVLHKNRFEGNVVTSYYLFSSNSN